MKGWKPYHTVWLVMGFSWVTNYLVRMGLSPALVPIRAELGLSHSEAGILATAFFYAYTVMQLPAGYLGDRVGRKVVALVASLGWAIGSLLTGFSAGFHQIFAARFLTGAAEGSFFSNDRPIISAATPKEKTGIGQSLSFAGLGLGMGFGILIAGMIIDALGWRWVFFIFSAVALTASFLIWRLIKEPPKVIEADGMRVDYSLTFTNRDLWLIYVGCIAAVYMLWVLGTWGPAMIIEATGMELGISSTAASLLGFSALPGLIALGHLSDVFVAKGWGRKYIAGVAYILCAISVGAFGWAVQEKSSIWLLSLLMFLAGFFLWGSWGPVYSLYADMVPRKILGFTYGVGNFVNFMGSLVAPWLSGYIKDTTGSFAWAAYVAAIYICISSILIFAISPSFRLGPEVHLLERVRKREKAVQQA